MVKLIVFDVDGTLVQKHRLGPMPGVQAFFQLIYWGNCPSLPHLAIATNQGGVGLRYWMEQEHFGNPRGYPTESMIEERLRQVKETLSIASSLPVYVSYRYQDRAGKWSPLPLGKNGDLRWLPEWRKPGPGMLLQAAQDFGISPFEVLYVGDSPEDRAAARAAGCAFQWAGAFFQRDWSECGALELAMLARPQGGNR